jgi:hypothetical protein
MNLTAPKRSLSRRARSWARRCSLSASAIIGLLFGYSLTEAIPNRATVQSEHAAERALRAGAYQDAQREFVRVLRGEPDSLDARTGLACVYYLTGHSSRAMLELTLGLERGLSPRHLGWCGHGLSLDRQFLVAKIGLTGVFAIPRVVGAEVDEDVLTAEPAISSADESRRLLIGSCLAYRDNLDGAGWYYAANALERRGVSDGEVAMFFRCLGTDALRVLGCRPPSELRSCALSDKLRAAYLTERPYLYPVESPAAFEGSP